MAYFSGMRQKVQARLRQRPSRRFGLESAPYLTKWLFVSALIGAVAGVGAILFSLAIKWATTLFLGGLIGYAPPNPQGEGGGAILAHCSISGIIRSFYCFRWSLG